MTQTQYAADVIGKAIAGEPGERIPGVIHTVVARNIVRVLTAERGLVDAINTRLPGRVGLPVVIAFENGAWQVVGIDHLAMPDPGPYHFVPWHHEAHQFNDTDGGDDVVWLAKVQYTPWLVAPTSPPSLNVRVFPGTYYDTDGVLHIVNVVQTLDMSPYYSEQTLLALVSLELSSGELIVSAGGTQPAVQPGTMPLAVVRLRPGAASIGWDDILDARDVPPSLEGGITTELLALLEIRRFSADGVTTYPANSDGLLLALLDASSGDRIVVPTGQYTGSFTIPAGVFVDFGWSIVTTLTVNGTAVNYLEGA